MELSIQELRRARGWKQCELADRAGIERTRLCKIESGFRRPRAEELARLAEVLACPIESLQLPVPARLPGAVGMLSAFRQVPPRLKLEGQSDETRLGAVRARFPQLWPLLEPVAERERESLRHLPSDSAGETCLHLLELARGALPVEVSLGRLGFDRWPVVDGFAGRCTLNHRRWALVTPDWLLIPQVTVLVRRRYRLDALVLLRRRRVFLDLELDGPGHDGRLDKQRELALGLPVLRVADEDLLTYNGLSGLLRDCRHRF